MKRLLIITALLLTINVSGQTLTGQVPGLQTNTKDQQRSLTMFFGSLSEKNENPAVFIDGKRVSFMEFLSINAKFINTISIEKKPIKINSKEYKEQMYIITKDNFQPKSVSLKEIKKKYIKNHKLPCFYFIDGKIAKIDEIDIFLDENNILEITCHLYKNTEENLKLNIIEIFTRSDENLKKANDIILR